MTLEVLLPSVVAFGAIVLGGAIGFTAYSTNEFIMKRKSNGRHRKASEAHRVGTGRGAVAGADAGGSTSGRAGAGMSTPGYIGSHQQIVQRMLGFVTSVQSKPSPEFSGVEFAAGVVTGARSFKVDGLGRLTGVSYEAVWTPGEVHAKCMSYDRPIRDAAAEALGETVEHSLTSCQHGFYAYYDGSNDYYQPGYVSGIVEGYGETVIGSRGFRCMKARIVALHIPVDAPRRALVIRNYGAIPQFDSFAKMLRAFPTDDAGQGISPANTPDFWTRSA